MDAAGNFVVTWSSNGQDGNGWGVYARRYDAAGVARRPEGLDDERDYDPDGDRAEARDRVGDVQEDHQDDERGNPEEDAARQVPPRERRVTPDTPPGGCTRPGWWCSASRF